MVQKPRSVPYNLENKVRYEEEKLLLELSVIKKVPDHEATVWCINEVVAPKPHRLDAIQYCSNR